MANKETTSLETSRLELREAEAADLDAIHEVFASNPEFLERRHGAPGVDGEYDLEHVTQYWQGVLSDDDRHLLIAVDKKSGQTLGIVDFMEESPFDGLPWIGLVLVDGNRHRRGFGSEIVRAITAYLAAQGHDDIRMAIVEDNTGARAFARSLGFFDIGDSETSATGERVVLLEAPLAKGEDDS